MATECNSTNSLQRKLAGSIMRKASLHNIRILLARGAKLNKPVQYGLRPLHFAVFKRYVGATRLLIARGCNLNSIDDSGYSALHVCAEQGYSELVDLLLKSGAAVDYRPDTDEEFPDTTVEEPLRIAIRTEHMDIARTLLEHGANPNKRNFYGSEINMVSDPEYLELLLTFGANPDSRDRSGMTPLMKAARLSQGLDSVLVLLRYGADVNAMTDARENFRTVLHYAVLSGNITVVDVVIRNGARLNYVSEGVGRPSPLDFAILKGDIPIIKLLLDSGADANYVSNIIGSSLHVACSTINSVANRLEILKMLLAHGADPNHRIYIDFGENVWRLRPVLVEYIANTTEPSAEVVRLLLKHGAKVIMNTHHRDPDGILNSLQKVVAPEREHIFYDLLDATQSFDRYSIEKNPFITAEQKSALMEKASNPLTLKMQLRIYLRSRLGMKLPEIIDDLELPKSLNEYLLFDR